MAQFTQDDISSLSTNLSNKCASDDSRLSDARTPTAHATSHKSGGSDAIKLDELAAPTDVTTINATSSAHGLCPKLSNNTSHFLRGDGTWQAPPGGTEAFPIGAVFIAVVATDPADLLGYGTWAALAAGRMLIGYNAADTDFDTVKETGGAKTSSALIAHTHDITDPTHNHTQDSHTHVLTQLRDATTGGATTNIALTADTSSTLGTKITGATTATNQAAATGITATDSAGSGSSFSIMNPYLVVYFWERTA